MEKNPKSSIFPFADQHEYILELILHVLLRTHAVMRGNNAIFNLFVNRHRLEFLKYLIFYNIFYELSTQFSGIWVSKQIGSFEELRHKEL